MATLETLLSKVSCGKQLQVITSFGGQACDGSHILGALSGLGQHEINYLFWAYLQEGSALKMKSTLMLSATNFLKENNAIVTPKQQMAIVKLVVTGLQSTFTKHCAACGGTGENVKLGLCQLCLGTGRVNISQRQIAKQLQMPWSSYYKNKALRSLLEHLLKFCAILEGNITRHVYKRLNEEDAA